MRILLFPKDFPSAATPGAGIFILRRAQALQALGHEVQTVRIVPHAPAFGAKWQKYREIPAYEEVEGIPVHTIRAVFPPRMIGMEYLRFQTHFALSRIVSRLRPDIVNASFLIPGGQIAVHLRGVPVVVTAHGSDAYAWPHRRRGLYRAAREAVRRAGAVTAVSDFIASRVRALYDRDVEVIWNGGDERFFFKRDRAQARAELDLAQDRLVIAYAGNLFRTKGLYELIDAAARMRDLHPLLMLAGEGPEHAALEARAQAAGVDVRFLGRIPSSQLGNVFAAATIVTLPSYGEGLPNVVCEAMLNGNAVVATQVGGIPEIVTDGETGLLVPAKDAAALAGALRRMAADDALRAGIEANALAFARANLRWEISARRYEQVYRRLTNAS